MWGWTGQPGLSCCLPLTVMSFRRHHSIGGKTVGQTWISFGFQCKKSISFTHSFWSAGVSYERFLRNWKLSFQVHFQKLGRLKSRGSAHVKIFSTLFLIFSLFSSGTKKVKKDFSLSFFCKVKQNEHLLFQPTQFSFCTEFFFQTGKALQKAVMWKTWFCFLWHQSKKKPTHLAILNSPTEKSLRMEEKLAPGTPRCCNRDRKKG